MRRKVPGVSDCEPLVDLLVHGQDIAVPLGRNRPVPTDAGIAALERLWSMGWPFWVHRRLGQLRVVATDGDWAVGSGAEVSGPVRALLLLATGRHAAALPELQGPGARVLTAQR
jgi:uncharacterized protein (TIGR03083 family)